MSNRLKQEVQTVLLEVFGGEVKSPDGLAGRLLFKHISSTGTYTTLSSALGQMDKDGLLVRDMPSKKRCTRIALPEYSSYPARKSLETVIEQATVELAALLSPQVRAVIDAETDFLRSGMEEEIARRVEERVAVLEQEAAVAKEEWSQGMMDREARLELRSAQVANAEAEMAEMREQLRIAHHNTETWKRKAQNRGQQPVSSERFAKLRDKLPDAQRRELDALMRELPRNG